MHRIILHQTLRHNIFIKSSREFCGYLWTNTLSWVVNIDKRWKFKESGYTFSLSMKLRKKSVKIFSCCDWTCSPSKLSVSTCSMNAGGLLFYYPHSVLMGGPVVKLDSTEPYLTNRLFQIGKAFYCFSLHTGVCKTGQIW